MDDAAAIRAFRAGRVDAFRHLVDRYQTRALAHARLLTRNEADAADATQDAFVDAFRNLAAYDPARQFYPWFYGLLCAIAASNSSPGARRERKAASCR